MERGTVLRQLRRLQDLTQQNIADDIGISQRQVCRIENGEAHPRINVLEKWCEALGITVQRLEDLCQRDDLGPITEFPI